MEKPNVVEVFEFRTDPEPLMIMAYYPIGNIADANIVDETTYISAFGQVLDGLKHLHENDVVHRDLKPENFLVEVEPLKVVITDFGLAKVVPDTTLLKTFCGTLKYLAPEVFPGLSDGHGPAVDVWSLGVIVLEWIYGIPAAPAVPPVKKKEKTVRPEKWQEWVSTWSGWLLIKLDNEDDCLLVQMLLGMIEIRAKKRWSASRCLEHGLRGRLFRRRQTDGLVVCADGPNGITVPNEIDDDGAKTPTAASEPARAPSPQHTKAYIDPEATIIVGDMWGAEDRRDGGTLCSIAHSPSGSPTRV